MRLITTAIFLAMFAVTGRADHVETLQAVGDHAEGAADARVARETLVAGGSENLVPVLRGFKGSSVLASNWLRSTFEAIADREIKSGRSLPKDELLGFIATTNESPVARRLAYEWLLKEDPKLDDKLIPDMLLDPSPEFRRDAVARLIEQAGDASGNEATAIYRRALRGAVHEDQVTRVAKALREAGVEVDLQKHFGFLTTWKMIGPFDNRQRKGYAVAYPPEKEVDLSAEYDGQLGQVGWNPITTDDDYGLVNIADQIENYKGSVMYATTTYNSNKERTVELRLGTPNAWKLWVNGQLVFEREEYHRSTRMDQYTVPVTLRNGKNRILLKVCQNEQEEPWAQRYQFQLRVCDSTGSAVPPSAAAADLSDKPEGAQR